MLEQRRREATTTESASAENGVRSPAFAVSGPSLSLPKGGGAIRGIGEKFAANPFTGTGSLSIPIEISPARSGFGPKLVLNYDSSAGNTVFGFGWDLSLPRITRNTDKRLPRYLDTEESDVFLLSGAEDLVPVYRKDVAGNWEFDARGRHVLDEVERDGHLVRRYRPRIEAPFARIERWTRLTDGDVHWRTFSRDNVVTLYGRTADSRIADPEDGGHVFSWLVCESYDDRGNAVLHEYVSEDSRGVDLAQAHERNRTDRQRSTNRYLKRILYGNRTPNRDANWLAISATGLNDWMFEVVFDYGEQHYEVLPTQAGQHQFVRATDHTDTAWATRPDPYSNYRAGFEVRSYRRCRRILMFHRFAELGAEPCLVRSTEFDYADLAITPALAIDVELAHQGSTRFASFIQAVTQSGYRREASQPVVMINGSAYLTYLKKSRPPIEFDYTKATIDDTVRDVDPDSLENLPYGVDGNAYQWADLDGEGLPGILSEQANAWFYKRNLSAANRVTEHGIERTAPHFAPVEPVAKKPNSNLSGAAALLDLAGDGSLDLVELAGPAPGFYERTTEQGWGPFKPFARLPNIDWNDPNLRFVDLDGDGRADVLITQDQAFTWHASLAETGFDVANRVAAAESEEAGPKLLFADGTFSVYLADMSGDGLTDLLRVRNGEVCYWPNLGYGRFGSKVALDNAPHFDTAEQFDQRRVLIADIDGTGCSDLIYLGADGVRIYFNQCGNRLSDARRLTQFPAIEDMSSVLATDLLGNGTVCLVWSSPLPASAGRPMRYIDLMGGQKPHLLTRVENNLGTESHVRYAPSTRFYLADKLAGKPWISRLPFPVQVVERVDTYDRISRNFFVTRYAYHHGYFDGVEREFRGFGMVEQWDTEEFAALTDNREFPAAANIDVSSHVPPVLTRTWFHTGVYLGRDHVSNFFAGLLSGVDVGEYYREPGLNDAQARKLLLDDTELPDQLSVDEEREACRALKGSMLRQEVYARDGTVKETHPYTVVEQNFTVCCLQPQGDNPHAAFFTHAREVLTYHYERDPADPRIAHALTLEVDEFGNLLKTVAVGYGRRQPDMALEARDRDKQSEVSITYTENDVTNRIDSNDDYRAPLECATRTFALTGVTLSLGSGRFTFAEMLNAGATAVLIPYEQQPTPGLQQKRLIEQVRTLYRRNDLNGPLPLGQLQSMALLFEGYKQAFTPGLLTQIYGGLADDAMLANDGRFVHSQGDANWWVPSGQIFYSPETTDPPSQELAFARQHFFLPHRFRNPFHTNSTHTETCVIYDDHHLLLRETRDALGNRVTAGERHVDPTQPLIRQGQDYRVLQPAFIMDANRNCSAFAFDALGAVTGTAVMGKPEDNPRQGDSLNGFVADQTEAAIVAHLQNPLTDPHVLLQRATTCVVYDRGAYYRTKAQSDPQPAAVYTLTRETHDADLAAGQLPNIQHAFSYSDGFDREIQKKIQAEPGPVPKRDAAGRIITIDGIPDMTPNDISPRWVGSGWTVFNNKGKPVRQYEPFFTDRPGFEFDARIGMSPVLFYDPVERLVATLHPNHTWEKLVLSPWRQETWDVNDTVLVSDPKTDADAGDFFARLPDDAYLPTWHTQRQGGALGAHEQTASRKAAIHAATPTIAHADSLGRAFLTIAHNRFRYHDTPPSDPPFESFHATRVKFDIKGNQRDVIDARDRIAMHYDYDMLGNRLRQASMDAGERRVLNDVLGKPLYLWDSRGHQLRTAYDQLRRPVGEFLLETTHPMERMVEKTLYGESQATPEAGNLRGRVFQLCDQAGIVTSDEYDFKGNLLSNRRQLAQSYSTTLNWSAAVPLEANSYINRTRYDAINRPIALTAPDNSVIRPGYNEANLLEKVDVNLRGAQHNGEPVWTSFVTDIDYDAKGRRMRIDHGNGVRTSYEYDPLTFRLAHLITRRNAAAFPDDCPQPPPAGWPGCQVQSLHYTYDPIGNVVHLRDDAQQTRYFRNKRVDPDADYTYDALYQLIEATGREHLGQVAASPVPGSYNDKPRIGILLSASDGNAVGRYLERYVYDLAGNFQQMMHRGTDPIHPGWTRSYACNEPSLLEPAKQSNRLSSTTIGAATETYSTAGDGYDAHGNMLRMPQLQVMQWDFKDQLQMTRRQAVNAADEDGLLRQGERTWYVYGAGGQRVRKVTELATGEIKDERIYIGDFELYRRHGAAPLIRETLHIVDDKQRIALIETRTQGSEPGVPAALIRYQFGNHLGSASLELDQEAQIISYEEYTPYGGTSYQAVRNQTETPKRYRYTNKERDEESGLYYHGARYYAPWLARWISADPLGIEDGVNVFAYAGNNPVKFVDPDGREIVISYKEGTETKTVTYTYKKDRKIDEKAPQFLKNTLKSLDYLVEKKATNITIGSGKDAKTVDILDTLIKDKKNKVTITEGTASTGNAYTPATNTVHFLHDQAAKFRKDSSKPWSADNTGRTSPAGLLAHELIHSYNDIFDSENYKKRRKDTSSKTEDKFSFPNKEEEYVTTDLANKVLNTLGEDKRQNYGKNYYTVDDPTSTKAKSATPKPAEEKKPAEQKKQEAPKQPATPPAKKGAMYLPGSGGDSPTRWSGLDMRFSKAAAL